MAWVDLVLVCRIIPARAGFTTRWVIFPPRGRDHPRACGVYLSLTRVLVLRGGSSPRVRGLPSDAPKTLSKAGIIPARAGFTLVCRYE